jgi:hypothetical protein
MVPRRSAYDQFCEPTSNDRRPFSKSDRSFARIQVRNASSSWVGEYPAYWIDSAVPAAWSSCTIGPWLRRGTISVAAGIPLPGGTTETWPPLLARNVSGIACTGSSRPS